MAPHLHEPSWQREQVTNNIAYKYNDPLAVIYNEGQWRLNRVSPLYNLQYDAVKLKQYSSKIRQSIISNVSTNATLKFTVKFEEQPHLKYSEDEPNGFMITVTSTPDNKTKAKVVYSAILLTWGVSTKLSNAIHLPYMLDRGEQRIGAAVKAALQTVFDCNIKQFFFSQHQVLQIGFNYLDSDTSSDQDPFVLVFKVPEADHKNKLTLAFTVEDVKIIWNGVKEEVDNPSDLVISAYQMLLNQIFHAINLNATVCELCEILLPKSEVKNNGIIKMKTPEMVNSIFTVINEITDVNTSSEIIDESTSDV